jgi:DNA/RNA endonuclease G (NUC1)
VTEPAYVEALRRAIASPNDDATVTIAIEDAVELLASAPSSPVVDPDYASRPGYDRAFLGGTPLPLPTLKGTAAKDTVTFTGPNGKTNELRYYHFSVVMSRSRRFARLTAVNIDGKQSLAFDRENDAWAFDPRIDKKFQVGNVLYANNPFDRGHLVRRLDPVWGGTEVATFANGDTFHFTNCTPQHEQFNRNPQVWAGIEDYILKNADSHDLRVTVFTAPVLRTNDPKYQDVRIPLQFWKVVAFRRKAAPWPRAPTSCHRRSSSMQSPTRSSSSAPTRPSRSGSARSRAWRHSTSATWWGRTSSRDSTRPRPSGRSAPSTTSASDGRREDDLARRLTSCLGRSPDGLDGRAALPGSR